MDKKDQAKKQEKELEVKVTKRTKIRTDVKAGAVAPPEGGLAK
jgi:hypothetical protein